MTSDRRSSDLVGCRLASCNCLRNSCLRNKTRGTAVSTKEPYKAELAILLQGFAANVRRLREAKAPGYSQEDLAWDTRLHRTAIGKWEQARSEPQLSTLLVLAEALGCTLNDLVEGLPVPRERRPSPTPKLERSGR